MAPRKRSVVWTFFRVLNEKKVHCLLCMEIVVYNGHTTNMLRHMRTKHPKEFSNAATNIRPSSGTGDESEPMITNSGDEYTSGMVTYLEVALEEDHPVQITTVNEADITNAINGILKAAEHQAVEGQSEVVTAETQSHVGSGPSPSTRKWSSIWTHYERLEDQKRALCLICLEKIQHHSSTSNLHRHLSKKHPDAHARMESHSKKRLSKGAYSTPVKEGLARPMGKMRVSEKYQDMFDGEVRVLERERELTEALRKAQQQEARALEQQRELLDALRRANTREAATEKEELEALRRAQEQEARALRREREEAQRERAEVLVERERLREEREELERLRREVGVGRGQLEEQPTGLFQEQGVVMAKETHG
ncbi:zinc finger BED domain-containing protein isoform X1 [Hypomesus transpacificus]|uniref:zinc finger BED domain-containing protein isoform X1 n=1 Tax=Hypomesus transpacificus TaxID=137520 RepID=UPI001F07699F|nr:zinc finger BED domain-containing protein isoform X1 [Hypomesus transpacificus]